MAIKYPLSTEKLSANHTEMHNVIAVDPAAPAGSLTVNVSGNTVIAEGNQLVLKANTHYVKYDAVEGYARWTGLLKFDNRWSSNAFYMPNLDGTSSMEINSYGQAGNDDFTFTASQDFHIKAQTGSGHPDVGVEGRSWRDFYTYGQQKYYGGHQDTTKLFSVGLSGSDWVVHHEDTDNDVIAIGNDGTITLGDSAYCSYTITTTSSVGTNFDPFNDSNYDPIAYTENVTHQNITYTTGDGNFTFARAGVYSITLTMLVSTTASQVMTITLKDGVTTFYTMPTWCNTSIDPQCYSVTIMREFSIGDTLNANIAAVANITAMSGTTMTINLVR